MRCQLCTARAGWLRRRCNDCRLLWDVWQAHRFQGMGEILDAFLAAAGDPEKVQRFLNAEPRPGRGTIRDQIAADMSNQLLGALGQQVQQSGAEVKRLRERGAWKAYDQRPPD